MRSGVPKLGEIRVPGLISGAHPPAPFLPLVKSVELLVDFLRNGKGRTTLLTGAGISVDSGIRVRSLPLDRLYSRRASDASTMFG